MKFEIAASVNTTVEDILLDDVSFKGFQADTEEYDIILPPDADFPEVTVEKIASTDEVDISGSGTAEVTITVNNTGEYTLRFTNAEYELNEDFEGGSLPSDWTTASNGDDATGDVSVSNGALVFNDIDGKSYFAYGELANPYSTDDLAGKKIVMEIDINPSAMQQWVRAMFTNGASSAKTDMAIEPYISVTKGNGDYTYKTDTSSSSSNTPLSPALGKGTVINDAWNHVKIEVSVDEGSYRITVENDNGTFEGLADKTGAVRENDTGKTTFTHVHLGTGGGATGDVAYDNVKVYVCSDIS